MRSYAMWAVALGWACGESELPLTAVVRTDSVGIEIVTTHSPPPAISLATPTLSIGAVEGDEHERLYRVAAAQVLDDGSILIVNRGSQELRLYGPDGTHRRSFGRRGNGPGEFRMPIHVRRTGDTVSVWDYQLRRMSRFGLDRTHLGEVSLTTQPANPELVAVFTDAARQCARCAVGDGRE